MDETGLWRCDVLFFVILLVCSLVYVSTSNTYIYIYMSHGQKLRRPIYQEGLNCMSELHETL